MIEWFLKFPPFCLLNEAIQKRQNSRVVVLFLFLNNLNLFWILPLSICLVQKAKRREFQNTFCRSLPSFSIYPAKTPKRVPRTITTNYYCLWNNTFGFWASGLVVEMVWDWPVSVWSTMVSSNASSVVLITDDDSS